MVWRRLGGIVYQRNSFTGKFVSGMKDEAQPPQPKGVRELKKRTVQEYLGRIILLKSDIKKKTKKGIQLTE